MPYVEAVPAPASRLSSFGPPYESFTEVQFDSPIMREFRPGHALVWWLDPHAQHDARQAQLAARRKGLPLFVILPSAAVIRANRAMFEDAMLLQPRGVLPAQLACALFVKQLLAKTPPSMADATWHYFDSRLILSPRKVRDELRKLFELAGETHSVSAASRKLYTSRRTLGRHFSSAGLPVPSHWLQFARLIQAAVQIQNDSASLFAIATRFGYPDGFTLSNQMKRMIGYRPSEVRHLLGWEWIIEAWIRQEVRNGGFDITRQPVTAETIGTEVGTT
jgi:AraC-like DNA-binding protein